LKDHSQNYGVPSRKPGFDKAAELFRKNNGKLIVETGCFWHDPQGCSTLHLAELAQSVGGAFFSVDLNPEHVATSRELTKDIPAATIIEGDSIEWIGKSDLEPFDLLYLDAFDYEVTRPNLLGIFNVAELGAALGKMAEHSVILMDDWNWGNGDYKKCALSKELLEWRGWTLVQAGYQLLFAR
jgi:hypothetical protein